MSPKIRPGSSVHWNEQIGGFQSVNQPNDKIDSKLDITDDSNDCNVADEEEENIANIKAQNADQTKRMSDN